MKPRKPFFTFTGSLFVIIIISFFNIQCLDKFGTQKQAFNQELSVGEIRSIITEYFQNKFGINVCFNSSLPTSASVIDGSTAYQKIINYGYSYGESNTIDAYLDELSGTNTKAVHITVMISETTYEAVFVPNANSITSGIFFDYNRPTPLADAGETCVSCTYMSGKVDPCKCVERTKTVCGKNPSVSCTEECGYCNKSSYDDIANEYCNYNSNTPPFNDPTSFYNKIVGSNILYN